MTEDKQRALQLLREKGRSTTFAEFKTLHAKFKEHPEAIEALRKGAEDQTRHVRAGSDDYDPSPDYWDCRSKLAFLKIVAEEARVRNDNDFLENRALAAFGAAAEKPCEKCAPLKKPNLKGNNPCPKIKSAL